MKALRWLGDSENWDKEVGQFECKMILDISPGHFVHVMSLNLRGLNLYLLYTY